MGFPAVAYIQIAALRLVEQITPPFLPRDTVISFPYIGVRL